MFRQYDSFELIKTIEGGDVPLGTIGVILEVLSKEDGAYEVEFVGKDGYNLGSKPVFILTPDYMKALPA